MKYTKAEFCEVCNMQTKHLTTYVARKKIELDGDMIDMDNVKNALFYQQCKSKTPTKPKPEIKVPLKDIEPPPIPAKVATPEPQFAPNDDDEPSEIEPKNLIDIEIEMQKAKLRRQINGDKKEKIIISKLQGQLVEVDIVEKLVTEVGRSITHEFRAVLDNFLTQFAFKYNIDATEVSTQRKHGIFILNKAYEDSIENVKKKIDAIIEDLEG